MRRQDNCLLLPRVSCALGYGHGYVRNKITSQCTASKEAVCDISVIVNWKNIQKILLNLALPFQGRP